MRFEPVRREDFTEEPVDIGSVRRTRPPAISTGVLPSLFQGSLFGTFLLFVILAKACIPQLRFRHPVLTMSHLAMRRERQRKINPRPRVLAHQLDNKYCPPSR